MQTVEQLENMGIDRVNAQRMLDSYAKRIGWVNGDYRVSDIVYIGNNTRDIELTCIKCGKTYHKEFINGRNKWSEMKSICSCEVEKRYELEKQAKLERQRVQKIFQEQKRLNILSKIGTKHGSYTITGVDSEEKPTKYTLVCDKCGSITHTFVNMIDKTKGICNVNGCGSPIKFDESYIGLKNNYLTVTGITRLRNKHRAFICLCDCGEITLIEPTIWEKGIVKSCGCKHNELLSEALKKENPIAKERLYNVYSGMKQRCYNPNDDNYHNYGGRGILICDEWLESYATFKEWAMSTGYDENAKRGDCTIDRIDVNGNYEPSNCRWADALTQARNKRNNVFLTINGRTQIMADWQRETGLSPYSLKKIANGDSVHKSKNETIKLRVTAEMNEYVKKQADEKGISTSEWVRKLIEDRMMS